MVNSMIYSKMQKKLKLNIKFKISMWVYWLCALYVITGAFSVEFSQKRINKCCPKGQKFDVNLNCVWTEKIEEGRSPETDDAVDNLQWFPFGSIVNSTTLKIHEYRLNYYFELLNRSFEINYGMMPNCSSEDTKQVAYFKTDVVEFYFFILYNNETMRIHITKPGSLHNPANDIWHFPKLTKESEIAASKLSADSLRTFPVEDACVDLGFKNIHFLVYCPCRTLICIRKCCSDGEFYNATNDECENLGNLSVGGSWRPDTNGVIDQYYLLSGTFPSCDNPLLLKEPDHVYKSCNRFNKDSDNDFIIFKNGSVKVNKYKNPYEPHQYCGEVTWHKNEKIIEQNLILCSALKNELVHLKPIKSALYGSLFIIGGICLLITVGVSLYLPELRRRMHNKIALSHNGSLMVAYFAWGIAQLSPELGGRSCMLLALLMQFTFLGSFFWLNVMCIDISMTFSATRSLGGHSTTGDYKKFLYYCIYSWGCTAVVSIVTVIMDFVPEVPYDFLRPGFSCTCGFNSANASILVYFYGPMSILLILNLVLFIYTSIKIMSVQRQTAILHKTDSNTTGGSSYQSDKQRYDLIQWLILYAKLFLLMGLTWIMEIVSWAVGGPDYYWYFSDILNLLRAIFIFILFVCKRQVLESLKRKFRRRSSMSTKTFSDVITSSTYEQNSKYRSSTNSDKRTDSKKKNAEFQKLILSKKTKDTTTENEKLEESCM